MRFGDKVKIGLSLGIKSERLRVKDRERYKKKKKDCLALGLNVKPLALECGLYAHSCPQHHSKLPAYLNAIVLPDNPRRSWDFKLG